MPKQSDRKGSGSYKVGYKKPPKTTQFKPGQSGNPKGRPRGKKNASSIVQELLMTPTNVTVNGQSKNLPAYAGAVLATLQKAMQGDPRSLSKVLDLVNSHAPDLLSDEIDAEVEAQVLAIMEEQNERYRALRDKMTKAQRRRYINCLAEMKQIRDECGIDSTRWVTFI